MEKVKPKQNILLLSAGRRVELLQAFRDELLTRRLSAQIFAADLSPEQSAACQLADRSFYLPRPTDSGYIDQLLFQCEHNNVGMVIPTIDTELVLLAEAREIFETFGISIIISDKSLIYRCRDKRDTVKLFSALDIDTPHLLDSSHLTFPCFAKPYDGSRSVGAVKLDASSDLTESMRKDPKLIFMEYIDESFHEYTIDAYFDQYGILKCLVPRHRLEIRDGEVSKGITRKNHVYDYLFDRVSHIPGARGCLTIQLFAYPSQERYAAFEINPRFGGGYPLSYAAGANYPGWLIDEYLLNRSVNFYDEWESDLLMLRYDAKVLVRAAQKS